LIGCGKKGVFDLRIVYVEDNPANLALVRRVARLGRHEVDGYAEGEDALEDLVENPPDLILIDIQLGGVMTGLDLIVALRDRGVDVPIIAVTAYAMMGDRERCLQAGFNEYLPKPLPVGDLVALFDRYSKYNTLTATVTNM
jgi:CheY-like chemotaxis protein